MKRLFVGFLMVIGLILTGSIYHTTAEAGLVQVNNRGYKVYIDDSSVYMRGEGHANVIITPYYARWNPSYPVEVFWGKGYCVYRLDKYGNRDGLESNDFALAIANYMSEHY